MKRTIHLICNAHLDPVWLWDWQEGVAETISTFRTAAEICEANDHFIFNHNEALLYQWIQEYEPGLFQRIQKLVRAGKWHIMGGWYLQPDCNMPSGESFVRQILVGKTYFRKHFGVEVTTAINFDPFGHTRGLVQILAKAGYDSYLFGRPDPTQLKLPGEDFVWEGYDGSQLLATRFGGWYNSSLGRAREVIEQRIRNHPDREPLAVLWGVGNHGGGPSHQDLRQVNQLIKSSRDCDIRHSTPEAYFKALRAQRDSLPKYARDLNPFATGCYTSMVRIKQKHRRLENEVFLAEKMATAAWAQKLMKYPGEDLREATRSLLYCQFHDILPGSSVQPVEESALQSLDHGLELAGRVKARAFFALAAGQSKQTKPRIPVFVYNPHPFKVTQLIACDFILPDKNWEDSYTQVQVTRQGKVLPSQVEKELSSLPVDWHKQVVFRAELEPGQMTCYHCQTAVIKQRPTSRLKVRNQTIRFTSKEMEVLVNRRTGLVDRYRIAGVDYLEKNAFWPLVMHDTADSWGMLNTRFSRVAGRFRLMSKAAGSRFSGLPEGQLESVRVIEDGPARSVIEAFFTYNDSFICQRYKLPKMGTEIEIESRVHWNEKDRMLKLSIPPSFRDGRYLGQVAYGVGHLPHNGDEAVSQKWVAVVSNNQNRAITCVNTGIYGSDYSATGLKLTLLRSPAYATHPNIGDNSNKYSDNTIDLPNDRYTPRMDQGERVFTFWLNAGKARDRLNRIDREALVKNEPPVTLSFFPTGEGKKPKPLAVLSDKVVQMTAMKPAENNRDLVIRLFEPTGRRRSTVLSVPLIRKKIKVQFSGFEIKTLKINLTTGKHVETDLLEKPLRSKLASSW